MIVPMLHKLSLLRFRSLPAAELEFDNPTFLVSQNGAEKAPDGRRGDDALQRPDGRRRVQTRPGRNFVVRGCCRMMIQPRAFGALLRAMGREVAPWPPPAWREEV